MTNTRKSDRRSRRRGAAAAVELALTLPFLLLMVVAGIDFARVFYNAQVIAQCAQTGALFAANPDFADKTKYESISAASLSGASNLQPAPTVSTRDGIDAIGNRYVEVTVSQPFRLVCRYVVIPHEIDIVRTSRARLYPAALAEMQ
jgi:Flp pilus assembly protein TadG